LLAPLLPGCLATPTPLAPGVRGSVGVPHLGVQTDAVELPARGNGYVRFRPQGKNYWGVPRLVRLIEGAAAHVAATLPGSPRLVVGDLSARRGGKISGHNSHRTGRDVDLLFYVTTPAGVPIQNSGFIGHEGDSLGFVHETAEFIRLDVPRQWELVKYMLSQSDVGVQFMFASQDVEALLIDYALARGEPVELIYRAQTVLLEPKDSLPHDDHIHLRIACTPEELLTGCTGGGPYWPWLPESPAAAALDPEFFTVLASDDPFQFETVTDPAAAPTDLAGSGSAPPGGV
jgi:penicillin-insensitive murein endopeptidase